MNPIRTINDIKNLGGILSIWAHPDDETFLCGGILAAAVMNGQEVACLTMTKGEAGSSQNESKWPLGSLGEIRVKEFHEAMKILGCDQHNVLNFPDGRLSEVDADAAVKLIKSFIEQYQPDTILTFGADGITGHPDHQTVSVWVSQAVGQLSKRPAIYHAATLKPVYDKYLKHLDEQFNVFFNTEQPLLKSEAECDICVKLTDDLCRKKCQALSAMPSQYYEMMRVLGDEATLVFQKEAFLLAK